jgi:hypothetical protein
MQELWKAIKGFEGIYEISNLGRVKGLERVVICKNGQPKTVRERILSPKKSNSGYFEVQLQYAGKRKMQYIHRLVAETFMPNPEHKEEVNHIDENKTNNRVDNLEWVTRMENVHHGTALQRRVDKYKKRVYQYTKEGDFVKAWDCSVSCAEAGFSPCNIRRCCHGLYTQHKGYKWSYAPPTE